MIGIPDSLLEGIRLGLADHSLITTAKDVLDETVSDDVHNADLVIQGYPADGTEQDQLEVATRGTWNTLTTPGVRRFLQLSILTMFDSYDPAWAVDETWLPAPTDQPQQLASYLAELTAREIGRSRGIDVRVLRLGEITTSPRSTTSRGQSDWLHVDDAVTALVAQARQLLETGGSRPRWDVVHVARGAGRYTSAKLAKTLGVMPTHPGPPLPVGRLPKLLPPSIELTDMPTAEIITIYGAGGPLGAVAAAELAATGRRLCLTDREPLAELATRPPQSQFAPRPQAPRPPHRELTVDVTASSSVHAAAIGSDCLINCTVVRTDPRNAFAVNVLGALAIMRAAVDLGIRRVIQTGPAQLLHGYEQDRLLPSSTPARPGDRLYFLTKLLAQEICRIIAEQHRIATPVLLFEALTDPDHVTRISPFMITWRDAGQAFVAAANVNRLPEPSPVLNVRAPSPHRRYSDADLRSVLDWSPQHRLDQVWTREHRARK